LFLLAENADSFGEVHLLNINLHPSFIENIDAVFQTTEQIFIASLLKKRNAFSHKGKFGHALLIAGNTGKTGAAVIAAKACLRSGVGLLTVNIPQAEKTLYK